MELSLKQALQGNTTDPAALLNLAKRLEDLALKKAREHHELELKYSELIISHSKLRADYAKATGAINEAIDLLEDGTVDESEILAVLGEGLEVVP